MFSWKNPTTLIDMADPPTPPVPAGRGVPQVGAGVPALRYAAVALISRRTRWKPPLEASKPINAICRLDRFLI
jgi:hypothetical protein